jgi:hypothetical protein
MNAHSHSNFEQVINRVLDEYGHAHKAPVLTELHEVNKSENVLLV